MSVRLDSWAILAWLDGEEPALPRVNAVVGSRPVVSWINLVEVCCRMSTITVAEVTAAAHGLMRLTGDPELLGLLVPPCVIDDLRVG